MRMKWYQKPKFTSKKWKKFLQSGCYSYALDLPMNEYALIGDFIDKRCSFSVGDDELLAVLKEELSTIFEYQIEEVNIDAKTGRNEKKILLKRDIQTGFYHFFREDKGGKWSHKTMNKLPERINKEDIISKKEELATSWCFLLKRKRLA